MLIMNKLQLVISPGNLGISGWDFSALCLLVLFCFDSGDQGCFMYTGGQEDISNKCFICQEIRDMPNKGIRVGRYSDNIASSEA